ncbi:hypothetical protein GCM10027160_40740 [Streptomyces calidiresistens]|uniref:Uncharacterized protein n=1 Tax=Streptomyces calidiresistens TaxID=1485586 RepID=A0A7W3T4B6_9ACTN|nr:hypothetical protein [Streptomyces calidiresistens]MBB0230715.1 hypothetical protein [Streptomyces calidiresistens]
MVEGRVRALSALVFHVLLPFLLQLGWQVVAATVLVAFVLWESGPESGLRWQFSVGLLAVAAGLLALG